MRPETARSLLQLPSTASSRDIERSFRRLARKLHPDQGGDTEAFRQLLQARAVLHGGVHGTGGRRAPLIIVHRGPWWRRLPLGFVRYIQRRRNPPPPRVS
ncbi:MAG TPA: J domain-containing protein [Acidimicrobiales bacterium]|nr:J domain-containing protein [Acidimicrobiales bacterium]